MFFSRRCERVRIVYWDRNGFAMWSKRLERGRFRPAFDADGRLVASAVEAAELALVLEGIDPPPALAAGDENDRGLNFGDRRFV